MRVRKLFIFYDYKKNIACVGADDGQTPGSGFILLDSFQHLKLGSVVDSYFRYVCFIHLFNTLLTDWLVSIPNLPQVYFPIPSLWQLDSWHPSFFRSFGSWTGGGLLPSACLSSVCLRPLLFSSYPLSLPELCCLPPPCGQQTSLISGMDGQVVVHNLSCISHWWGCPAC